MLNNSQKKLTDSLTDTKNFPPTRVIGFSRVAFLFFLLFLPRKKSKKND